MTSCLDGIVRVLRGVSKGGPGALVSLRIVPQLVDSKRKVEKWVRGIGMLRGGVK